MNSKLKAIMNEKGLSAYKVGKALGYKSTQVYNILNGWGYPYPKFRKEVSKLLDVEEASLFDSNGALLPADEEETDK